MADNHAGDAPSEAPEEEVGDETVDVDEPVEDAAVEDETVEPAPDIGRTELKAIRARLTLEEEAEAARRRILGPRRAARRRAASGQPAFDEDDDDLSERLRELVRGVEEETERLQDDVSRLRSAAGRAGATLHEEIERAASELADQSTEELQTTVGQTATESLEALTAAIDTLQETTASLNNVA